MNFGSHTFFDWLQFCPTKFPIFSHLKLIFLKLFATFIKIWRALTELRIQPKLAAMGKLSSKPKKSIFRLRTNKACWKVPFKAQSKNEFIHSIFNFYSNLAFTFHSFRRSSFPMLFNSADCPYWNRFLFMAKIRQNFYLFFWKFPFDVLKFKFRKRSVLQIHFGNAKLDSTGKFICKLK